MTTFIDPKRNAFERYQETVEKARVARDREQKVAGDQFRAEAQPIVDAYQKAITPLRNRHDDADRASIVKYTKTKAEAWAEYEKAVAPLYP